MRRRYTPRLSSFDYTGRHRYSWTICVHDRRPVLTDTATVAAVRSHFLYASEQHLVAVLAYCFMPDHLHLLIEGLREDSSATRFVNSGKQCSGYWFKQQPGQRLWQRSSWDRVLRSEEDTWTVIRYILANPVRAGLVESPMDYPFSGSFVFAHEQLLDAFHETAGRS